MTSIKVQTFEIIKRLKTAGAAWFDFRLYCVLNQSISELCCTSKEILLIYKICKNFYICGQIINFNIRILIYSQFISIILIQATQSDAQSLSPSAAASFGGRFTCLQMQMV